METQCWDNDYGNLDKNPSVASVRMPNCDLNRNRQENKLTIRRSESSRAKLFFRWLQRSVPRKPWPHRNCGSSRCFLRMRKRNKSILDSWVSSQHEEDLGSARLWEAEEGCFNACAFVPLDKITNRYRRLKANPDLRIVFIRILVEACHHSILIPANQCPSMPPFLGSLFFVLIDSISAGFSRATRKHSFKLNLIQR